MCQLSPVIFHGDTIFCVDYQDQPYTPAKPIVENLGLGWPSQSQKLNANKDRWGITMIVIPSSSGEQQMLCLPVRKLPAYLASINPKKVRTELRPKIELYQAESDDALWNYWISGRAERPVAENGPLTPSHRAELKAIVDAKLSTYPASVQGKARSEIWTRFNRHFKIAEYAQLPVVLVPEARDYLIEMKVKSLKTLPAVAPELEQKALPRADRFNERAILEFAAQCRRNHTLVYDIHQQTLQQLWELLDPMLDELLSAKRSGMDRDLAWYIGSELRGALSGKCRDALRYPARVLVDDYNPGMDLLRYAKALNSQEARI